MKGDGDKVSAEEQPMRRNPAVKVRNGLRRTGVILGMVTLFPMVLASCGPVSLEAAERQCFDRARLASRPRGEIAVGATSNGGYSRVEVEVTSDYLLRKDPSAVYESCVMSKAGQAPSRPLYARPDWRA
jgi:hypothetical protein